MKYQTNFERVPLRLKANLIESKSQVRVKQICCYFVVLFNYGTNNFGNNSISVSTHV